MSSVRTMMAIGVLAVGVVAGCSSESTTTSPGVAARTSAAQAPAKPLTEYLLQASDVPTGFSQMTIPADQLGAAASSLLASTKNAKVSPASCQPDLSGVTTDAVTKSTASYFSNASSGDLIGSVVVPDTTYASSYKRYNLGDCATHEVTSSVNGQSITGVAEASTIEMDVPGVTDALVIKQNVSSQVPGAGKVTQTSLIALLPADGVTVTVTQKKLLGSQAPDVAVFTTVVAAAAKRLTAG